MSQVVNFKKYLQSNVEVYFPEVDSEEVEVSFLKEAVRLASRFYYFTVRDTAVEKNIFVKIAMPQEELLEKIYSQEDNKKPRLYPRTNPLEMSDLEAAALSNIYLHFQNQEQNGLDAIRVLDYLPEKRAIVMEELDSSSLRDLLGKTKFIGRFLNAGKLKPVFMRAGQWLKHFHTMSGGADFPERLATRDAYVVAVKNLGEYLEKFTPRPFEVFDICASAVLLAEKFLGEQLPTGLGHSDFAPRNILVTPEGGVAVIDTFANWRTSIYEDIGYFINGVYTIRENVLLRGGAYARKDLNAYEKWFLSGYFDGQEIPFEQVKLFELLALLDKWASITENEKPGFIRKILGRVTYHAYFAQRANLILDQITRGGYD